MDDQQKSAQVRDVYAHFGLAVYLAQCLEQSIFLHLVFFEHFPKAIATFKSKESWISAFNAFESRELGQTMGKLIRRLKEAGQPTEYIQVMLDEALQRRNWLAHGYFPDRAAALTLESGRERMIRELESIQSLFIEVASQIDAITLPVARNYGLTEEVMAKLMAQMREQYASL